MRRLTFRLGVILLLVTICSLVLLRRCQVSNTFSQEYEILPREEHSRSLLQGSPLGRDLPDHKDEINKLRIQVAHLKEEISKLQDKITGNKSKSDNGKKIINQNQENFTTKTSSKITINITKLKLRPKKPEYTCDGYVWKKIEESEIIKASSLNNEYEVVPFSYFTWSRIYPSELGLGKRVVEKPIGYRRKDLIESITVALNHLNERSTNKFTIDDFVEGVYRTVPTSGSQSDLIFRDKQINQTVPLLYRRVRLFRPFAPIRVVKSERKNTKQLINIVLPLSGRLETFQGFMENLVKLILKNDRRIFLTVVYFGDNGLHDVRNLITTSSKRANFKHIKLLTLNETFSRGKALEVGASHWTKGDVLLFMCDVDIVFSTRFLERCRTNTVAGKSVYYPIVFSLYNPKIVYPLDGKEVPSELDQLIISRNTGFWRDFGYGMTCQYRSDFLNVQGFDANIIGWGGEDVLLYRKFVKSNLVVVRSNDPGIFHLWHSKNCSSALSPDQYRACLTSKALNEASHAQLGLVAFKDQLTSKFYQRDDGEEMDTDGRTKGEMR